MHAVLPLISVFSVVIHGSAEIIVHEAGSEKDDSRSHEGQSLGEISPVGDVHEKKLHDAQHTCHKSRAALFAGFPGDSIPFLFCGT